VPQTRVISARVGAKEVVKAPQALQSVAVATAKGISDADGAGSKGAPSASKFVKYFCPLELIRFADGTSFQFRLIELNTGGYSPSSHFETGDVDLANKLREAAKNPCLGLKEI
jgi:hypothetical protein